MLKTFLKKIQLAFDAQLIDVDFNKLMNDFVTKDSGLRRSFETGAVRDVDFAKPRYDLIPPHALTRVAMLYTRGAEKYGENNWQKGIPTQQMLASAMRHLEAYRRGECEEDHLAAVVWNVLAMMQYEEERKDTAVFFRADAMENQ